MERDAFIAGARLFDDGAFFEAHEAWEDRWRAASDDAERLTLQGLIQIAAAFHKLFVMKSPESAARLLARGLEKLAGAPAEVHGAALSTFRAALVALSAQTIADVARADVPRLLRRAE